MNKQLSFLFVLILGFTQAIRAMESTPDQKQMLGAELIEAAYSGDLERVKILIDAEADVNQVNINGRTALMHAAAHGDITLCELLCDAGSDITYETKDRASFTALYLAAYPGNLPTCELLVEKLIGIPNTDEKKRRYTLMSCLKCNFNRDDYRNLRHVFQKHSQDIIKTNKPKALHLVMNDLLDGPIKQHLLQKYFPNNQNETSQ